MADDDVFLSPNSCKKENWRPWVRRRRDSTASLQSVDLPSRKRKRRTSKDEDSVSLQSLELAMTETKKKRKSLKKVASIANILSPINAVKKIGQTLQRSNSFKMPSPAMSTTPYRKPKPAKILRQPSKCWRDSIDDSAKVLFNAKELERQENIFELLQGEENLIQDLKMVKKTYHDSMKSLNLMSEEELKQIFGIIEELVPLHEELVAKLKQQQTGEHKSFQTIGSIMVEWMPCLSCYIQYCANQVFAKALLDRKKNETKVDDFLQRCLESPFSRRLDLWSFLDVPRSRLVKYPLLLRKIQKHTSNEETAEIQALEDAIQICEGLISDVDKKTGESKCKFTIERLEYLEDKQMDPLIAESKVLLCEGILRNNRGTKLTVFLFEDILVLTRPATRGDRMTYQVYRQPIPADQLVFEDCVDGEVKMGSFRGALMGQAQPAKNMFKVSFKDSTLGQSHTLQAMDEHDKRQWIHCLRTVISKSDAKSIIFV